MIACLFVRQDSIYKTMPECDCYDIKRDALTFTGGMPVIAHPPCRSWGVLKNFAKAPLGEHELAPWAIAQVRKWGGVVEHPLGSSLFWDCGCPPPGGQKDFYGGWTLRIDQFHWGHKARKRTLLYICGTDWLPPIPQRNGSPTHFVSGSKYPQIPKRDRDATPPAFAAWLVEIVKHIDNGQALDWIKALLP